jgi:phosphoribosylanthranilate isomerase
MNSRVLVKVCGVTTPGDAAMAVEAGADALGFNFWPRSPRYLAPAEAAKITANLPKNTVKVGVFVDAGAAEIEAAVRLAGLDLAQIHGLVPPGLAVRYWQALAAGPDLRERMAASGGEAFLIDTPAGAGRGGTGRVFDWSLVRGLPGRIVLAGGLGADNVGAAVRAARSWGVDACSRLESAPGRKDAARVRAFVAAVREAEGL